MSSISEKVRIALFAKLNVSGVTTLATGGIYHKKAPESANMPFVVFHRQTQKDVLYALGGNAVGEWDWWLIKALMDEDSSQTKEPEALAEEILTACETAIGNSLTLSGNTVRLVRRKMDIPDYIERLGDRDIHHHGFYLEVFTD